ncbi:HTH domain-containing protein [Ferdinandcohnia quinoae]|uniref:Uncharacterized protein n=1 Tax=Fredinandcohnia quinoae TaxID=2918902 RepID=A0AAW5EBZ7_9BACI|nr:HTH domain-containing protein [Fredinandcohnia sp. SECRCQ15]MCH1627412.1 hypothetical protein [Fredinandcohnia sp. SECRCQ15]
MLEIKLEDNIAILQNKYQMSDDLINKILFTNDLKNTYLPIEISTLLARIEDINETQRVYYVLDLMHRNLGMSKATLAAFGGVDTKDFEEFLNNPESLNEKKKFVLAVRIMFLHFVLKGKYTNEID